MTLKIRHLSAAALVAAAVLLCFAAPAAAEISGGCRASINGTDVATVSSQDLAQAIPVQEGGQATVVLESPTPLSQMRIYLDFFGIRIPAVERPVGSGSVRETVPVDQYAKYGVGLYRVIGEGTGAGQTCSGAALVHVAGNPLQTTAGMVGAGAAGIGALGVLGATAAGAFGGPTGMGWRPKVSGLGLLGGLLAGVGGLVLGQQYSLVYPTAPMAVTALAGGLVGGGVVLPSLGRLFRL